MIPARRKSPEAAGAEGNRGLVINPSVFLHSFMNGFLYGFMYF